MVDCSACGGIIVKGATYVADRDPKTGEWVTRCTNCVPAEELKTQKVRFMHEGPAWVLKKNA